MLQEAYDAINQAGFWVSNEWREDGYILVLKGDDDVAEVSVNDEGDGYILVECGDDYSPWSERWLDDVIRLLNRFVEERAEADWSCPDCGRADIADCNCFLPLKQNKVN